MFRRGLRTGGGGNDSYFDQWYVQGAALHCAASALVDASGNDQYHAGMFQSIGHAKDFSSAVLHDLAGNDTYSADNTSIGEAWFNSVAVLWDDSGNDTVSAAGNEVIGWGSRGEEGPCYGIFLHGTGICQIKAPEVSHVTEGFWNKPGEGGARNIVILRVNPIESGE